MTLSHILKMLEYKLVVLKNQRVLFYEAGDVESVMATDADILETESTLNMLSKL